MKLKERKSYIPTYKDTDKIIRSGKDMNYQDKRIILKDEIRGKNSDKSK